MKYCFFSAQYLPVLGGVERYTYNLARELVRRGERVLVVTSAQPGLPEGESEEDGILVWRAPSWGIAGGRLPFLKPGAARRALTEYLDGFAPDRIVVQTHLYALSLFGADYARRRGVPAIAVSHATEHIAAGSPLVDLGIRQYEHLLMRGILRRGIPFWGVSERCCEWLGHFGVEAKGILYNAVPADLVSQSSGRDFRAEFGIGEEEKVVSFVGRLIEEKGVLLLCEAVASLPEDVRPVLMIAGTGPLLEKLRAAGTPGVHVLGGLQHEDVIALLTQSDIYCLPTYYPEGFPTGLLEAALCGAYLVATDRGGARELLEGGCGTLLPADGLDALPQALRRALEDDALRAQGAENAGRRVRERFTFERTCDVLVSLDWKCVRETRVREKT